MSAGPAVPRRLAIMGSGETAPTMVKVHRQLLERLGPPPVPAVLLDTPFGFQENVKEIAARAVTYFRESLQATIAVTGPSAGAEGPNGGVERAAFTDERLVTAVRDSRYVFAGPGSPSYALRKRDGAFVLGVHEHTACIFDLDAGTASVEGRGVVTVRAAGRSATLPSGEALPIARILEIAEALARGGARQEADEQGADRAPAPDDARSSSAGRPASTSPLVDVVREREADFATAVASRDMALAASIVLNLERDVTEWSTDIPAGDELERAHASLRSLILVLGRLSEAGARDPRQVIGPFVEALLELRNAARQDRRFADADFVRERLAESGIEVRDTPDGSEWLLAGEGTAGTEAGA